MPPSPRSSASSRARGPAHLYEGLLTVLMRLVFILYAEDRDLLPSRTDGRTRQIYETSYAVRGLYARLVEDAALNPDTMDERRGGWGRLLALFRLIHKGHGSHFVQARGGKLFDPDQFPFLEGRMPQAGPAAARAAGLRRLRAARARRPDDAAGEGRRARAAVLPHPRRRADRLGLRDRHGLHGRDRRRALRSRSRPARTTARRSTSISRSSPPPRARTASSFSRRRPTAASFQRASPRRWRRRRASRSWPPRSTRSSTSAARRRSTRPRPARRSCSRPTSAAAPAATTRRGA